MSALDPSTALFGKTRRGVLALLFGRADGAFYLREIAKHAGTGMSQVQRELSQLVASGLVLRERRANQVFFRANPDAAIFEELRGIVTKTFGVADVLRDALKGFEDRIDFAFVYGSVARGDAKATSDVDLLMIGDIGLSDIAVQLSAAEDRLRRTVSPVMYSRGEFLEKAKAGHHFVSAVLQRPKLFLIGTQDGLEKLVQRQPRQSRKGRVAAR